MKIAKAKAEDWDLLSEIKYAEVALVADNALVRGNNHAWAANVIAVLISYCFSSNSFEDSTQAWSVQSST